MKQGICCLVVVLLLLSEESDGCTTSLCETHCEFGYYSTNIVTSWGRPCTCMCCRPVVCRMCMMRKKIIAKDKNGCLVCKCGWLLK